MVDDLYIPARRAERLAENISAFLAGDPVDDDGYTEMIKRLEAIQGDLVLILQENDLDAPDFVPVYQDNPYA